MIALVTAVLLASVLGSLHCAGMCGPFVAFAVGGPGEHRWLRHVAYHGGRLSTYTLLGAVAGAVGALVDLAGTLAGLQSIATALAGGAMIVFGAVAFAEQIGVRVVAWHPPRLVARLLQQAHLLAKHLPPVGRALAIGMVSTLLPCGWLYAFAVTAAGTGSPWLGAITMAVFWVGTLPVMVTLGLGVQHLLGFLGPRLPLVTCVVLMLVGALTLSGRMQLSAAELARLAQQDATGSTTAVPDAKQLPPCCRGAVVEP